MSDGEAKERPLVTELRVLLNRHSAENGSNTPDFILAEYMVKCLDTFDYFVRYRADWYGRMDKPGGVEVTS